MYFVGLLFVALVATASSEFCYSDVEDSCGSKPQINDSKLLPNCNAKYGAFEDLQADLQAYANANIEFSFEYLLMSTHFGNYEANREGLKGLYRKLSDKAWDDAIDVIKYITKRGGRMNFNQLPRLKKNAKENHVLQLNEINSLAKALDTQKLLAEEALRIHAKTVHHPKQDASVAHYIEEKFVESQADEVRKLSGYTNDLKNFLEERDASLARYLFDEYIKSTL